MSPYTASSVTFSALDQPQPSTPLQTFFRRHWPSYLRWFLREGDAARPSYLHTLRMLKVHMPELVPVYHRLVELVGGGDRQARFLGLYCPTPFTFGCSQAVWTRNESVLLRNYDYPMHLCDRLVIRSAWTGTRVIAMSDCAWGVLDGLNEHGLAVSLAFGGRRAVGEGFGITLILRYVLETCRSTVTACQALQRLPVHMSYNIAVLDGSSDFATVQVSPDREALVSRKPVSTNHQGEIEWHEHARMTRTLERGQFLDTCIHNPHETASTLLGKFLHPPLYRVPHGSDWGTLYTAIYRPSRGEVSYCWPGAVWRQGLGSFVEGSRAIHHTPIHGG